eukprot:3437979-Amphidinium_carterae.1
MQSELLKNAMPKGWLYIVIAKGWLPPCAPQRGYSRPKGGHRKLEFKALAAITPKVTFDWMKARQSDRDALEGRVPPEDLAGLIAW